MLGTILQNNDVYVFFEKGEIETLEKKTIFGTYINTYSSSPCPLEVCVENSVHDRIEINWEKNEKNLIERVIIKMSKKEYESFKIKKNRELHEGFRHICLKSTDNLDFCAETGYLELKLRYMESLQSR